MPMVMVVTPSEIMASAAAAAMIFSAVVTRTTVYP